MSRKEETRPILVQEQTQGMASFEVDGITFKVLNLDTEFTIKRDRLARIMMQQFAGDNEDFFNKYNAAEVLALCVERVGEKWSVEQHNENIELFESQPFRREWENIVQTFFGFGRNLITRGIPTL